MDARGKLVAIGWLYILAGLHSLISLVTALLVSFPEPVWDGRKLNLYLGPFLLPIGIGLLRAKERSRRWAVAVSWGLLILVVLMIPFVLVALVSGDATWKIEEPADGEELGNAVGAFVVIAGLFLWQLRELRSVEVRRLTAPAAEPVSKTPASTQGV